MRIRIALVVLVLAAGGCSNDEPAPQAPAAAPATASTTAQASEPLDAGAIIKKLEAAGLGLTAVAVQDEDTDPNNLIGRPNGYTSRASADLPGGDKDASKYDTSRGLVVEVYADADGAKRRADYIQGLQKNSPILGTEWDCFTGDDRALVRVSGKVKPSLAKKVETAVAAL